MYIYSSVMIGCVGVLVTEVGKKLGHAGIGRVLQCNHKPTGKEFAVKFYSKHDLAVKQSGYRISDKLRKDLAAVKAVDVPSDDVLVINKVLPLSPEVYDIFEDDEHIYVVMDVCANSLQAVIRSARRMQLTDTWISRFMLQVFNGLAFMHDQNMLHTDVKESNILVSRADANNPLA
eukprot:1646879-Amphidinium_carterae.1